MTTVKKSFFEQYQLTIWACTILISLFGTAWKYNENLRNESEKTRADILLLAQKQIDDVKMLQYQIDELKTKKSNTETASNEGAKKTPTNFPICAILPKQLKLHGQTYYRYQ